MILFVGLGNPGSRYVNNRHNVGWMVVDAIRERWSFAPERSKFQGHLSEGSISGTRALVLKPTTYMNESGRSVGEAVRFYKIAPAEVVVFHDELDLPAPKVRIKTGGGAAGHNGIRSIASHIGPDFRRVRIGIGHPGGKERVSGHVLGDFAKSDRDWLDPLLDVMADQAPLLAAGNDGTFQNRVHLAMNPPAPDETPPAAAAEE